MTSGEAETANRKIAASRDSEIKATELVEWVIDAPVENNPVRPACGWTVKRQGMPKNHFRVDAGKPDITRESGTSSQSSDRRTL